LASFFPKDNQNSALGSVESPKAFLFQRRVKTPIGQLLDLNNEVSDIRSHGIIPNSNILHRNKKEKVERELFPSMIS
jgi:hypothetical protein